MRPSIGRLVFAAATLLFLGCSDQRRPEEKLSEAPAAVSSVAGPAGLRFGLASGSCTEGKCRAVLQLVRDNRLVDSAPLEFAASEAPLRKEEGETGLTGQEPLEAWTAGKEEGAVTTALRAVNLAANRSGVLVHQVGGFEHIKRRYDLFAAEGDKLKRIWSAEEGQGPAWSSVDVAAAPGGDEIIYLLGYRARGKDPDPFEARRLGWDEATKSLSGRPKLELPAVVAGDFPTAEAARRAASGSCLSAYWVLPADVLGKTSSRFVLAMVAAGKQAAEAELARACDAKPVRRMAVFRPK